jgi:hypothetical protein
VFTACVKCDRRNGRVTMTAGGGFALVYDKDTGEEQDIWIQKFGPILIANGKPASSQTARERWLWIYIKNKARKRSRSTQMISGSTGEKDYRINEHYFAMILF